uniref:Uncharacterized protein n=1 Tax=Pyramimonas orientalis virus TaxID=455367 RepID=A0A7M3UP15_POV01|nr:hypothetical protein HWQ62_00332 [Pyramimonas orientalis virus]
MKTYTFEEFVKNDEEVRPALCYSFQRMFINSKYVKPENINIHITDKVSTPSKYSYKQNSSFYKDYTLSLTSNNNLCENSDWIKGCILVELICKQKLYDYNLDNSAIEYILGLNSENDENITDFVKECRNTFISKLQSFDDFHYEVVVDIIHKLLT